MALGRTMTVLAAAALLPLTGAAGVLMANDERRPLTAEALVARAQDWLVEHDTAAFSARTRMRSTDGYAYTVRSEGRVQLERGFRSTDRHTGGVHTETLEIGTALYVKEADSQDALASAKWGRHDQTEQADRAGVVPFGDPSSHGTSAPIVFSPTFLLRDVLTGIEAPELGERDQEGNLVVRAELDPERSLRRLNLEVDEADLELRLRRSGEIVRMVVDVESPTAALNGSFRFTSWETGVDLSEPAASEIDPTPYLHEEALANFDDADVFAPAALPDGWSLGYADVLSADETVEGCRQASLDFDDPTDPEGSYLYTYQLPVGCADLDPPRGAEPLRAGSDVGWIEGLGEGGAPYWTGLLRVGDTAIQFETDLAPADVAAIFADLRPLAFPYAPATLSGVGRTRRA